MRLLYTYVLSNFTRFGFSTAPRARWEAAMFASLVGNDFVARDGTFLRALHIALGCEQKVYCTAVTRVSGDIVDIELPEDEDDGRIDFGRYRTLRTFTNKFVDASGKRVPESEALRYRRMREGTRVTFALRTTDRGVR